MAFCLLTAVKNEAPYLIEWVAYHKVIGFDQIIVCSNDCTDGTDEILSALSDAGEIVHYSTRPGEVDSPQACAANLARGNGYPRMGEWGIFLDLDEFLNVHVGERTVHDLAKAVGSKYGILINWRVFGDSANKIFPGRHISNCYSRCARVDDPINLSIKTFFTRSEEITGFSAAVHRCDVVPHKLALTDFLVGSGSTLSDQRPVNKRWLRTGLSTKARSIAGDLGFALAQINHYAVRDPFSFMLKKRRGRGFVAVTDQRRTSRHNDDYYARFNRNEDEDKSILFWECAVTEEMARLSSRPGVSVACKMARRRYESAIDEITLGAFSNE